MEIYSGQNIVLKTANETPGIREAYIAQLQSNMDLTVRKSKAGSIESIDAKLLEMQKKLISLSNKQEDYTMWKLMLRHNKKPVQTVFLRFYTISYTNHKIFHNAFI